MTEQDWHQVLDVAVGYLGAKGLLLVVNKAFLEPAAVFVGRWAWRKADTALGDTLPDWIPPAE